MRDQPRYEPLEASAIFADGRASRPLVEGTVARGHLRIDHHFFEGRVNGQLVHTFPEQVTTETLQRGQQRYNIFCTPCHGGVGHGDGMAVQRGYPRPPSFHSDRLRSQPVGHFYDVMTNGYGRMMDYKEQIPPADRWAIIAYVRALQTSQFATRESLTERDLEALRKSKTTPNSNNTGTTGEPMAPATGKANETFPTGPDTSANGSTGGEPTAETAATYLTNNP